MPHSPENLTDRATPLLKERIRVLFHYFPKALAGEEEPIHQMRVAARRLRVALPVLSRKPRGRRVRKALSILRDVTRAGGGSRDLDVGLALLEERVKGAESIEPELAALLRRLRGARRRSRGRMAEDLMDLPISRLRRRLAVVVGRQGEDLFTVLGRLRHEAEAGRTDLEARLEALGERYEPADLHKLRIRARRLRYTAEILDVLKGQDSGAPALFKRVQERLGKIHDASVLAAWMAHQATLAQARGALALAEAARRQHEMLLEASREEHRRFLAERPRELLKGALEAMAPTRVASDRAS